MALDQHRHPQSSVSSGARPRRLRAALVVAGLVLGACSSSSSEGSGAKAAGPDAGADEELPTCPLDALAEAKAPVEVEVWFSGLVSPPSDVLADMVERFNASQDKVVVSANSQGNSYDEGLRKYQGASATPAQLPDVLYLGDTMLGELVDKGQVLPAQACMEADDYDLTQITPSVRAAYSVDDVLWAGYMNVSTAVLYYNKLHFEAAGLDPNKPPTTLAEVAEFAKVIKDKGVAPKPFSFLANETFFNAWAAGIGQDMVDNDNGRAGVATEATFATPELEGALQTLADMDDQGLLNPFPVTDGSIDQFLALATGQSSMLIETSTASGTIAQVLGGDLTAEEAGIDFDASEIASKVVPASGQLPGLEAPGKLYPSGGAFFIMNTGTPAQQAGSWEFLKFMLQPENAKRWHLEGGFLPPLKSVVDDPDVKKFHETDLAGLLLKPAVDQLAAADPDQTGPLIGPYTEFQSSVRNAIQGVLFDGKDPKTALAEADAEVDAALEDYNGG